MNLIWLFGLELILVSRSSCNLSRPALELTQECEAWGLAQSEIEQWIQLDAEVLSKWNDIITEGRGNDGRWVTSFTLNYTANGVDWLSYDNQRIFHANYNSDNLVTHTLNPPVVAQSVRVQPVGLQAWPIIRLEASVETLPDDYTPETVSEPIPAIKSGLAVTVSSAYSRGYDPSRIRLDFNQHREGGSGWAAAANDLNQWVQVSSFTPKQWVKISTQGRGYDGDQWVTSYSMTYTENGIDWNDVDAGRVFTANSDRHTIVTYEFDTPFMARAVRLHPLAWYWHISLRMELYFLEV